MLKAPAIEITGGLSRPSKMPGPGFSIPADTCITGTKLRKKPKTVCFICYAHKGRYVFSNVQRALRRRYTLLMAVLAAGPESQPWALWLDAMVKLIGAHRFFRFHDSGDLQSLDHLRLYIELATRLPGVLFWLPTRELNLITSAYGSKILPPFRYPHNLCIRYSASMMNTVTTRWRPSSGVWSRHNLDSIGGRVAALQQGVYVCPAPDLGGTCGQCRACWDNGRETVVYLKH